MDRTDKILLLAALKTLKNHILFKKKNYFLVLMYIVIIISLEVLIEVRHLWTFLSFSLKKGLFSPFL